MADKTPEQIAAEEKQNKTNEELVKKTKTEQLREMSKKYGVDFFNPEVVDKKFQEFTEWQTNQKSEQEKLQEMVNGFETKKKEWENEKSQYDFKFGALDKNIDPDKIDKAYKLVDGDVTKLDELVKEFPSFQKKKKENNANVNLDTKKEKEGQNGESPFVKQWKAKRGR